MSYKDKEESSKEIIGYRMQKIEEKQLGFYLAGILSEAIRTNLTVKQLWNNACKYIPEGVKEWNHYIKTT